MARVRKCPEHRGRPSLSAGGTGGGLKPVGCEGLPSQPTKMTHWVQGHHRVPFKVGVRILDYEVIIKDSQKKRQASYFCKCHLSFVDAVYGHRLCQVIKPRP